MIVPQGVGNLRWDELGLWVEHSILPRNKMRELLPVDLARA
jgi:hypothetical protein